MESSFVHINAWVDDATQSLAALRLRVPTPEPGITPVRGTTLRVDIPLDAIRDGQEDRGVYVPRRPLSRRDSMKRRDALLMGKEGSRRRQRWENSASASA